MEYACPYKVGWIENDQACWILKDLDAMVYTVSPRNYVHVSHFALIRFTHWPLEPLQMHWVNIR